MQPHFQVARAKPLTTDSVTKSHSNKRFQLWIWNMAWICFRCLFAVPKLRSLQHMWSVKMANAHYIHTILQPLTTVKIICDYFGSEHWYNPEKSSKLWGKSVFQRLFKLLRAIGLHNTAAKANNGLACLELETWHGTEKIKATFIVISRKWALSQ